VIGVNTSDKELSPDSLVWAIVSVLIAGLGVIIGLMAVMKNVVGFNDGVIGAVTLVSLLMVVAVEAIFISLLFRRRRVDFEARETGAARGHTTNGLPETEPRALPENLPSVTEHTTRTFDAAYVERESE
jgi:membrane protein YdbS with pleckstrin-like domain